MNFVTLGVVERVGYTLKTRSRAELSELTQKIKYKNKDNIIMLCELKDTG